LAIVRCAGLTGREEQVLRDRFKLPGAKKTEPGYKTLNKALLKLRDIKDEAILPHARSPWLRMALFVRKWRE